MDLQRVREDPDRWRRLFDHARVTDGRGWCLCREPRQPLVIRRRSGRFWLACWPGGGASHADGCPFHDEKTTPSARDGYTRAAIAEDPAGSTRIRLSDALTLRGPADRTTPTAERTGSGASRAALGLLGLLHYLWERADLNGAAPPHRRRGWVECHAALAAQLPHLTINNAPVTRSFYAVPPYRKDTAALEDAKFALFLSGLHTTAKTTGRGLVLGAVKDISATKYGHRIALRHHRTPLFLSDRLYTRLTRSYRPAFSDQRPADSERVLLALVEKSSRGNLNVVNAAVMLTNHAYVPADSSHEVRMADALAEAGRHFVKPLRYDGADAVFPDFVLVDTDPVTYVEVWGITGRETYEQRKQAKREIYQQGEGSLLEWDVREPIPAIPQP